MYYVKNQTKNILNKMIMKKIDDLFDFILDNFNRNTFNVASLQIIEFLIGFW